MIPGKFAKTINNVFSPKECQQLIELAENQGFNLP